MAYNNLQEFIAALEQENELIRISEFVDPVLEISEITDRISKQKGGGKALLFENTGTDFPILMNAMGSDKRMQMVLNVSDYNEIGQEMESLFKELSSPKKNILEKLKLLPRLGQISSWMPKVLSGQGACQQVIDRDPDLSKLPILKTWQHDGGRFITLPMVNTRDPHTGIRNVGMYRIQIFDKQLTGMHWHKHKVGARHYNEYKALGQKMPVAIALGGDLTNTYAATAPLPDNIDEYMLAGFLRKKRVNLVKCITQDIEVPADADFVIEGYVDPAEELIWEGPFGDHTGFYSLADWYPRFHVTCITHRKNAVFPATIVGVPPQEDTYIAKATERIFLAPIKMTMLPEMTDMDIPAAGTAHNLTIVKIQKAFAGHAQKVMNSLWGAGQMMFNKILVVADEPTSIQNYKELARVASQQVDPVMDIHFSRGALDVLDHSASKFAFGSKMCFDLTSKETEERRTDDAQKYDFSTIRLDKTKLNQKYSEITEINDTLLSENISLVLVAFKKNKPKHAKELIHALFTETDFEHVKFILVVDHVVDIFDIETTVWIASNNIEPNRDSWIIEPASETQISHIGWDGSRKTKEQDNFRRDWPNIVVASDETIAKVDALWSKLNIGDFIPSPSLKFKALLFEGNATVHEL